VRGYDDRAGEEPSLAHTRRGSPKAAHVQLPQGLRQGLAPRRQPRDDRRGALPTTRCPRGGGHGHPPRTQSGGRAEETER